MNSDYGTRLALAMRLGSPRRIIVVMQVVLYLLRRVDRIELSLWEPTPPGGGLGRLPGRGATLFISAALRFASNDAEGRSQFEHRLREAIEQVYIQQRIEPVEYNLQIL